MMKPFYNTSIKTFISPLSMLYLQKVVLVHLKKCVDLHNHVFLFKKNEKTKKKNVQPSHVYIGAAHQCTSCM